MNRTRSILIAAMAAALIPLAGCPAGGVPGAPKLPGGGSGKVDPDTCGNYAASDAGRKLKAFLGATVRLEAAVKKSEDYVRETCAIMGKELGMAPGDLEGDTRTVCELVINSLNEHLKLGVKANAKLDVKYEPAVCTVNVDVAASAAAKCEAKAEADVSVRCSGSCSGTCTGRCDGTCATKGAGGECAGECQGTCEGSCSGGCEGHADVEASAQCEAHASVEANVEAECTEPKVEVKYDAKVVLDKSKLEAAQAAIQAGLPRILYARAKVTGPLKAAFTAWAKASKDLAAAGRDLASSFGEQALCITGQIAAAAKMVASIQVSIEVQVEVSASASASAGAGG